MSRSQNDEFKRADDQGEINEHVHGAHRAHKPALLAAPITDYLDRMVDRRRYQFRLKTLFVATTAFGMFFAWLAALLGGSEWAAYCAFLIIVGMPIVPLILVGLSFVAYLVAFLLYVPCWAFTGGLHTVRKYTDPWLSRLSTKRRLFLKVTSASIGLVCIVLLSPRYVQQCVAGFTGFALILLMPIAVVVAVVVALSIAERHRYRFSLRSMLLAVALIGAALAWLPNTHPIDWLLGFAFDENTIYSERYSAWRWHRIHKGMSKDAVLNVLGPPLQKYRGQEETWYFSTYGPSETYHRREVVFRRGIVVEKTAELYVD